MTHEIYALITVIGSLIDFAGVLVILIGIMIATTSFITEWITAHELPKAYQLYRQSLARVILLGLEFLVAGDIIRSVGGSPTFYSVGVLAVIVVIRSFLSITFQMEVEGRWPWQKKPAEKK